MSPKPRYSTSYGFDVAPGRVVIFLLQAIWILAIMYYELGTFLRSLDRCKWPSLLATPTNPTADKAVGGAHMLIVADPQILDKRSYPGQLRYVNLITQYIVDLNMRKAWRAAQRLNPDAAMFLGDMMDNGRVDMPLHEYDQYFARFKGVFAGSMPQFFVPGNHDIGLSQSPSLSTYARERYVSSFGEFNRVLSIANHSVIFMDAPNLVEEDNARIAANFTQYSQWKHRSGGAVEFLRSFGHNVSHNDDRVILFSHIPMHHSGDSVCGSGGERNDAHDAGFHKTLSKDATMLVLDNLQPSLIVTSEERNTCEFTHVVNGRDTITRNVREVSVKSFNMMSIKRPAFHLLTVIPPSARPHGVQMSTHADAVCLLPDQLRIYISIYFPLSILTILVLALSNWHRVRTSVRYRRTHARAGSSGIWGHLARLDTSRSSGRRRSFSSAHSRSSSNLSPDLDYHRFARDTTNSPKKMAMGDFSNLPDCYTIDLKAALEDFTNSSGDEDEEEKQFHEPRTFCGPFRRAPRCHGKVGHERSIAKGLWYDTLTVAVYPLILVAAISWWMLNA